MFKIITFLIITLFAQLYMKIGILLKCGNNFHYCIISPQSLEVSKIKKNKKNIEKFGHL